MQFLRTASGLANRNSLPDDLRRKALEWVYTLFAHNQNETQAILRAATATGYGLDPEKYVSTYPGGTVNIITGAVPPATPEPLPPTPSPGETAAKPPTDVPTPATSRRPASRPKPAWKWWQILGVAALTAAGAGIGWGVGALMTKPSAPASPTTAPPPDRRPVGTEWQLKIVDE